MTEEEIEKDKELRKKWAPFIEWSEARGIWQDIPPNDPRRADAKVLWAILIHVDRMLSSGRIPRYKLVRETLDGTRLVPSCGTLGCALDHENEEWVH
jgi:hypothetical protein